MLQIGDSATLTAVNTGALTSLCDMQYPRGGGGKDMEVDEFQLWATPEQC